MLLVLLLESDGLLLEKCLLIESLLLRDLLLLHHHHLLLLLLHLQGLLLSHGLLLVRRHSEADQLTRKPSLGPVLLHPQHRHVPLVHLRDGQVLSRMKHEPSPIVECLEYVCKSRKLNSCHSAKELGLFSLLMANQTTGF